MMIERIGKPAMLEQLAEESSELTKAALKLARVLRCENPTPVTLADAQKNLVEEFTDVFQCAAELKIEPDLKQVLSKQKRFLERWKEQKAKEQFKAKSEDSKEQAKDPKQMTDEELIRWFFFGDRS